MNAMQQEDMYEVVINVQLKKFRRVSGKEGGVAVISQQVSNWTQAGSTPAEAFHNAAGEGFEDYVRTLPAVVLAKGDASLVKEA